MDIRQTTTRENKMRKIDETIERRVGELWNEMFALQMSRPPVLTNAETPEDEQKLEEEFDALCLEHGIGEEELEVIAEKYSVI
jgi:hypothetical protein